MGRPDQPPRRGFEAEHLAAIGSDARLLRVEMGDIARAAEQVGL